MAFLPLDRHYPIAALSEAEDIASTWQNIYRSQIDRLARETGNELEVTDGLTLRPLINGA
jgi:hypothetical protein